MPDNVDSKDDTEHQEKLLQYNIVKSYQNNIIYMTRQNEKRAEVYKRALISFYVFVCGIPVSTIIYLITNRLLCQ
jgi:ABC-type transport system involved in Fe-S cluster assembly fused permease/ATPase subunit